MPSQVAYDAVVIGSGPNGLAAAITLARAGRSVVVFEGSDTLGGGTRTQALTLPGYQHDVCAAVHPLAVGSPFFRTLPLDQFGLEWIFPPLPLAHPLHDGSAATLARSLMATGASLGEDAAAYRRLIGPLARQWDRLRDDILAPLRVPRHPIALARFGWPALQSARALAERHFQGEHARALFAGMSAHAMLPLEAPLSAAFGLTLAMLGHAVGWPLARGGSQRITEAMAAYLRALGGEVVTSRPIASLDELPRARAILCDVTPRQFLRIAGKRLPTTYAYRLHRFRYGPGVFKVDFALDGPIPWRAEACARAGTVHVGGTLAEIAAAERAIWRGECPEHPFVLVAQQSLFDPTRAPTGKHTVWAYCHLPNGSSIDMTARIERQIERFAPGFRDRILLRHTMSPGDFERYNPNDVGGDINGGVQDLGQLFTRPLAQINPYATALQGVYLCSSSTPPGGGVHGMCGYYAAQAALHGPLK
jgi:phytoene dehydrogenase-like protein